MPRLFSTSVVIEIPPPFHLAPLGDGTAKYTPGVSRHASSATIFDNVNHLGTSTLQTNSSQSTTATRRYDAFGNLYASTGTPAGPFGFAGKEGYQEDPDSGLKLLGERYYDPSTGRFLTRDCTRDGRNWYAYCENNPVSWTDANGNQSHRSGARESTRQRHTNPRAGGPEKKDPRMRGPKEKKYPTQAPGSPAPSPAPAPGPRRYPGSFPQRGGYPPLQIPTPDPVTTGTIIGGTIMVGVVIIGLIFAPEVTIPTIVFATGA